MIKKLISDLFSSKRDTLEWKFYFLPSEILIREKYNSKYQEDIIKIIGFTHFLYRYLYICDERVTIPTKAYFLGRFKYGKDSANPYSFYENLLNVFSENEIKATNSFFSKFNSFLPIPPLNMVRESRDTNKFAEYSFKIRSNKDEMSNFLKMSLSPDKVLLPILIVVLYDYIYDSLSKEYKIILNEIIEEISSDTDLKKYRTLKALTIYPNETLKNKKLHVSNVNNL